MLRALLLIICGLLCCAACGGGAAVAVPLSVYSPWWEQSSAYFDAADAALGAGHFLRVVAQLNLYDDMSLNFATTTANGTTPLVLWGDSGEEERKWRSDGGRFRRKWQSTLPQAALSGAGGALQIVGTLVADLRQRGLLDVLVQSGDGALYVIDGADTSHTLRPVTLVAAADEVNVRLKHPQSPQIALATVMAPCGAPDVVFVNELGQLVLLQLRSCEDATGAATRYSTGSNSSSSGGAQHGDGWVYQASLLVHDGIVTGTREVLPFSVSQEDIDGDCAPDLLYAVRDVAHSTLELFAYRSATRHHTLLLALTEGAPQAYAEGEGECYGNPVFVDFGADRGLDVVLPVCSSGGDKEDRCRPASPAAGCTRFTGVRVFLNTQSARGGCNTADDDDNFVSGFSTRHTVLTRLSAEACGLTQHWRRPASATRVVEQDKDSAVFMPSRPEAPLLLRPGDYNRDRLTDFVVPSSFGPLVLTATAATSGARCTKETSDSTATRLPCVAFVCTALDPRRVSRLLAGRSTDGDVRYRDATPFFSSVTEAGRLDIVLTSLQITAPSLSSQPTRRASNKTTATAEPAVHARYGYDDGRVLALYQYTDLSERFYFLLASVLHDEQPATQVRRRASQPAWHGGVVHAGAVHQMAWMDIHTRHHSRRLTQLARTQAHALQATHVLVGLGETFSYVSGYTVGVVADGVVQTRQWPAFLVPNSEVFAVLHDARRPSHWHLQLYLSTSRYKVLLIVSLALALVVLGVPVILLRFSELRQDFREWKMG